MELGGDDGVLEEDVEGDDAEGVFVGGFEDDGAGCAGLLDLEPAGGADAPAVSGFEAGEAEFRVRGGEVVAEGATGGEEGRIDDAADGVHAAVFGAGVATAVAVEAGEGLGAAGFKREAEDVFLLLGEVAGHRLIVVLAVPLLAEGGEFGFEAVDDFGMLGGEVGGLMRVGGEVVELVPCDGIGLLRVGGELWPGRCVG